MKAQLGRRRPHNANPVGEIGAGSGADDIWQERGENWGFVFCSHCVAEDGHTVPQCDAVPQCNALWHCSTTDSRY